jgi:uncharacterized iron-regulated membrane protein
MSKKQPLRNPRLTQSLLRWHRRIGLTSALFVILLVVTGIPLHHASQLNLTESTVQQDWLLDFYGIEQPTQLTVFKVDDHRVIQMEDAIYLDQHYVVNRQSKLIGAVADSGMLIAVTRHHFLLMSPQGELIDQVELPIRAEAIARHNGSVYLSNGQQVYQLLNSLDGVEKVEVDHRSLPWIASSELSADLLSAELKQKVAQDFRSRSLNWERVLLDLHSGRLFGGWGPWIMDIAGLLFLVMAISGVWIWSRRR